MTHSRFMHGRPFVSSMAGWPTVGIEFDEEGRKDAAVYGILFRKCSLQEWIETILKHAGDVDKAADLVAYTFGGYSVFIPTKLGDVIEVESCSVN